METILASPSLTTVVLCFCILVLVIAYGIATGVPGTPPAQQHTGEFPATYYGDGRTDAEEIARLRTIVMDLKYRKHQAYYERSMVLALLAHTVQRYGPSRSDIKLYTGRDEHFGDWATCLYAEIPGVGQLNWHFKDSHAWMVQSLKLPQHPTGWDRRTREQKYAALENYLQRGQA